MPIICCKSGEQMVLVKRVLSVDRTAESGSQVDIDVYKEFLDACGGIGCLPGNVSIKHKDDVLPLIEPCRKVSFASYDELKANSRKWKTRR